MSIPIQETYIELRESFARAHPSYSTGDIIFNDLYGLSSPLTEKEISVFISRLKSTINFAPSDSLENKLYQFIAASHFSYLYGNFYRIHWTLAARRKADHKIVSKLVKTQCINFNAALLEASLSQKTVIDITEMYIKYLINVEKSTMSRTDKLVASVTGFDLDKTKRETKTLRLELQQRLSDYLSTRKTSETISINPTFPSSAPSLQKKEKEASEFKENLKNKSNAELKNVLPEHNTLPKEKDIISPVTTDKPKTTALQTNTSILTPLSEKPKEPTIETSSKNASGFIDYLMGILRAIVQLVSNLINKLRFHANTPSTAAPKTPVSTPPQQEIRNRDAGTNNPAPKLSIPTSMHWQKPKPTSETVRTENPNELTDKSKYPFDTPSCS